MLHRVQVDCLPIIGAKNLAAWESWASSVGRVSELKAEAWFICYIHSKDQERSLSSVNVLSAAVDIPGICTFDNNNIWLLRRDFHLEEDVISERYSDDITGLRTILQSEYCYIVCIVIKRVWKCSYPVIKCPRNNVVVVLLTVDIPVHEGHLLLRIVVEYKENIIAYELS